MKTGLLIFLYNPTVTSSIRSGPMTARKAGYCQVSTRFETRTKIEWSFLYNVKINIWVPWRFICKFKSLYSNTGFNRWFLKIYDIEIQVRIKFDIVNSINMHLILKIFLWTTRIFNFELVSMEFTNQIWALN